LQHLEFSESGGECVREWYELKGETRGPVQSFYDRARTRLYKDGYSAEEGWSYDIYFDPAGRKKYETYGYTPGGLPSKDCKYFKDTEVRREEIVLLPTEPGKRFGRWTEWYPNGQKKSEVFERQRGQDRDWGSDGWRLARSWQENGALATEEYVGPGEARITACYANGTPMAQVHVRYTDATNSTPAVARKLEWFENGRVRNEENHRNGRLVERTEWNDDGTVTAHTTSP
jgi:antitoxin component YwqK of YwqJK toxin-antitoxin module